MPRPRLIALLSTLAVSLLVGPTPVGVALAADPVVVVRPGDTLTAISKRTKVAVATLVELNHLADPNRIMPGQRLRTALAPAAPAAPAAAAPAKPAAARVHVVASGEHLTGIARRYSVTIAAISQANGISNPSRIYAGQRLTIPGATPAAPAAPAAAAPAKPAAARVHVVASGEHLTGIARRYSVTIAAISQANGISNPSRIYAGQRLTIPGATPAVPAAPAAASASMPASMAALVARRDGVRRIIVEEAQRYAVSPAFALAVAWQESGWQQGVVSHAGAVGVMQLMPGTARVGRCRDARSTGEDQRRARQRACRRSVACPLPASL